MNKDKVLTNKYEIYFCHSYAFDIILKLLLNIKEEIGIDVDINNGDQLQCIRNVIIPLWQQETVSYMYLSS
jgi:hypothetical protein